MKVITILDSIGEGIVSLPETLWDGIKRTGESLAFWDSKEETKISGQNERAYHVIKKIIDYGILDYNSPIEKSIRIILYNYYESLSDVEKKKIKKAAILKGAYLSGKISTSTALSQFVAIKLTKQIAEKQSVKFLFKSLASIEFTLITAQGLLYKAGASSDRLKAKFPKIWAELKSHDLDMVYFIIEKPMQKYLNAIRLNRIKLYKELR